MTGMYFSLMKVKRIRGQFNSGSTLHTVSYWYIAALLVIITRLKKMHTSIHTQSYRVKRYIYKVLTRHSTAYSNLQILE